jgi:hypothetical protein
MRRRQESSPGDAPSGCCSPGRRERSVDPLVLGLLAKRHRDMARLRNQHCTRLHALRGELHAGGVASEMTVAKANERLSRVEAVDEVTRCRLLIAAELVEDIIRLDTSLKASKKRVNVAVLASGPTRHRRPRDRSDHRPRPRHRPVPDQGHFATYNATAPIEASSGGHSRHRPKPRAIASSTTPCTLPPSPSSVTTPRVAPTTTARSLRASRPKRLSAPSSAGSLTVSTPVSSPTLAGRPPDHHRLRTDPGGPPERLFVQRGRLAS